jgi:hypothetical protein
MGLDIYVGTLTRYYVGDWETTLQKAGQESGALVIVVWPSQREGEPAAVWDEVRAFVLTWQSGLNRALAQQLDSPLTWPEDDEQPYFTDRPDWLGYAGLMLWAAYAEHPQLHRPSHISDDWPNDPALAASNNDAFDSCYGHLLYGVELWLPRAFDFNFRTEDAFNNETFVGSSHALLRQLDHLNRATWNADRAMVRGWRDKSPASQSPLEDTAQYGFSIFLEMAERSVAYNLPMKLDY